MFSHTPHLLLLRFLHKSIHNYIKKRRLEKENFLQFYTKSIKNETIKKSRKGVRRALIS